MFEKDIYQLIRGLRAHKGAERDYINQALAECRREVRTTDLDAKATALLKLVYLEMFGHDMSWASFNVLEVMSSAKFNHKRVGYLAAVQSFRPDTEVLMLAENLLKKDLGGADKATIALVLTTIPHVVSPAMANSLLADLLTRLGHSSPAIRKKTIVTLYRLALVYPETLRPAWPKIKELLLDEDEDPSVTAAIVNVVCELGWRRPQDFLPLAPRLFELLTAGGNNWMAIKIIKLFSTLTPLEPRLVKKLLPPLTSIIKTTPAMSLLYECVNGIIQGGIMEAVEGTMEGDEVARLCVNKLRAMLVVEGDPNLRFVALLAFAKITSSHADIVAQHSDVILECIDDPDISVRTRALDLVVGMINANNLQQIVERLLKQLRSAGKAPAIADPTQDRGIPHGIEPLDDDDDEDMQKTIRAKETKSAQAPPLPDDYRTSVIERILEMCSREMYAHMNDFEWYIGVLVELVKQCPASTGSGTFGSHHAGVGKEIPSVADAVGDELLNVAVRVKAVRPEAAAAAQSLLLFDQREQMFPAAGSGGQGVLSAAAFIAGDAHLPPQTLASYLQAVPKVFTALTSDQRTTWTSARRTNTTLLIARVIHFLEPLTLHPSLEVQERAVEYLDLMRLASEAASSQPTSEESDGYAEPPLLLTQAIPSLFTGMELNPVAAAALRKVPLPADLNLDEPINSNLQTLLQQAEDDASDFASGQADEVSRFYNEKPSAVAVTQHQRPAADSLLDPPSSALASRSSSYQHDAETDPLDRAAAKARQRAERRERYKDDPYYIDPDRDGSGTSTPTALHNILRSANGEELDVDAIPVMELKLDAPPEGERKAGGRAPVAKKKAKRRFEIAGDETLEGGGEDEGAKTTANGGGASVAAAVSRAKKSLLEVDSSGLSALSLSDDASGAASGCNTAASHLDVERRRAEEEEMTRAIKEVERLRLEMQRAQERIQPMGVPEEGTVVRRKKKKVKKGEGLEGDVDEGEGGEVAKRRKKKKKRREGEVGETQQTDEVVVGGEGGEAETPANTKRKKKKRQVTFEEEA
ncbi:AP-3 complex subunit delta [Friedmanniomyces endolithicus]|uniref:AP-3 complex subunit delta n=1 Tax=Friedmanniomyces endolithicus TaxID=329885 RepID=A0AAN6K046_9PEZI|nr:AP-3 complex subunit delta [Friedmanniomyces endolithicus]KAK0951845.1 AP-3 complex subunit delta [Friedmanniomyces endolithicus]KAK1063800.1 AP-3 complex subunit delta [Friedmanniomyces endolithicus]